MRLQQIFWNVLKNAVKFTPHGGAVKVRTQNPLEKPGILEVKITDTGIGIEPEMLNTVFDAFIQEEHDYGHRFGGIGLGLAITDRLVRLQHGKIHVESDGRGRGATFCIQLPLARPEADASNLPASSQATSAATIGRRILLVEDHDQTRSTLIQLLQRRGHSVVGAGTVGEALEHAAKDGFDLVISDLGLPDRDGHQLMTELAAAYGLSGIALSGYGMDEDIRRSRASGFFVHLTKPVDIRMLEAAITAAPYPVAVRLNERSDQVAHRGTPAGIERAGKTGP